MKHKEVREERKKKYGDAKTNHTNIANAWHSILVSHYQQDLPVLPPHVVCLMMASFKLVRAALPFQYDDDDFIDARNYLDFAEEIYEKNTNGTPENPSK